jgi:hypothetical protein
MAASHGALTPIPAILSAQLSMASYNANVTLFFGSREALLPSKQESRGIILLLFLLNQSWKSKHQSTIFIVFGILPWSSKHTHFSALQSTVHIPYLCHECTPQGELFIQYTIEGDCCRAPEIDK